MSRKTKSDKSDKHVGRGLFGQKRKSQQKKSKISPVDNDDNIKDSRADNTKELANQPISQDGDKKAPDNMKEETKTLKKTLTVIQILVILKNKTFRKESKAPSRKTSHNKSENIDHKEKLPLPKQSALKTLFRTLSSSIGGHQEKQTVDECSVSKEREESPERNETEEEQGQGQDLDFASRADRKFYNEEPRDRIKSSPLIFVKGKESKTETQVQNENAILALIREQVQQEEQESLERAKRMTNQKRRKGQSPVPYWRSILNSSFGIPVGVKSYQFSPTASDNEEEEEEENEMVNDDDDKSLSLYHAVGYFGDDPLMCDEE